MQATVQAGVALQDLEDELRKKRPNNRAFSSVKNPLPNTAVLLPPEALDSFPRCTAVSRIWSLGSNAYFPTAILPESKMFQEELAGRISVISQSETKVRSVILRKLPWKVFRYFPENNRFYGYLVKNIESGISVLREVMVNGYRPSVARVYSEEDARQHFYHFYDNKCVLLFMAEEETSKLC